MRIDLEINNLSIFYIFDILVENKNLTAINHDLPYI